MRTSMVSNFMRTVARCYQEEAMTASSGAGRLHAFKKKANSEKTFSYLLGGKPKYIYVSMLQLLWVLPVAQWARNAHRFGTKK